MDEQEFRRVLDLFPVVRSRNYHPDSESSKDADNELTHWQNAWDDGDKREAGSQGIDLAGPFWGKLKLMVERKAGATESERFCKAFQNVCKKLVYEELSLDAARNFINDNAGAE